MWVDRVAKVGVRLQTDVPQTRRHDVCADMSIFSAENALSPNGQKISPQSVIEKNDQLSLERRTKHTFKNFFKF